LAQNEWLHKKEPRPGGALDAAYRPDSVTLPSKTVKAQPVMTIILYNTAAAKFGWPRLANNAELSFFQTSSLDLPRSNLRERCSVHDALSSELTNWIPGIALRLKRSSFVMDRCLPGNPG
jgi:hypothetical protein